MAAIDPSEPADLEDTPNGTTRPRATLKILREESENDEDDEEDDEEDGDAAQAVEPPDPGVRFTGDGGPPAPRSSL